MNDLRNPVEAAQVQNRISRNPGYSKLVDVHMGLNDDGLITAPFDVIVPDPLRAGGSRPSQGVADSPAPFHPQPATLAP